MKIPLLLCAALSMCAATSTLASGPDEVPAVLAMADRAVAGGRAVRAGLAQTAIETSVEIGRIAPNADGGLIGALIIISKDDRRKSFTTHAQEQANADAAPLKAALSGFDVAALALAATREGFATPSWFGLTEVTLAAGGAGQKRADFLAAAATPQAATIDYRYELSPDFSQIRVFADIMIAAHGKSGGAAAPLFRQRLCSIVQLANRSYEPRVNAGQWSADEGRLARNALADAFGGVARLIPMALELDRNALAGFADKKRAAVFAAGLNGPLVERGGAHPDDVILWSGGLVIVQTAR